MADCIVVACYVSIHLVSVSGFQSLWMRKSVACLPAHTISRSWMLMPWCLALPHLGSPVSGDASRKQPYPTYLNQLFQPAT